jgi:hypothetical protein
MLKINFQKSKKIFLLLMIGLSVLILGSHFKEVHSESYTAEQRGILIRFGITAPLGVSGYDLTSIHALSYLDWAKDSSTVPDGVEYIHVIRVNDAAWGNGALLSTLSNIIERYPGNVWIIGNEPDRFFYQDSITAEVYAQRYFDIANVIRAADTTAKIGFGSVVQPTPIRIRYLEKALDELERLANNNRAEAMELIDIWSIHAFILNENPNEWGAGVPVGFENDWTDAELITDFSDTHSIEKFTERVINFRSWMKAIGEKEKPLWITEYGSLFPPIDRDPNDPLYQNYVNISDELTSKFMIDTFNFLLSASDSMTGLAEDNNRLVQRWFWYSLNDYRYNFGGTLFDPDQDGQITEVGKAYKRYIEILIFPKTYLPMIMN